MIDKLLENENFKDDDELCRKFIYYYEYSLNDDKNFNCISLINKAKTLLKKYKSLSNNKKFILLYLIFTKNNLINTDGLVFKSIEKSIKEIDIFDERFFYNQIIVLDDVIGQSNENLLILRPIEFIKYTDLCGYPQINENKKEIIDFFNNHINYFYKSKVINNYGKNFLKPDEILFEVFIEFFAEFITGDLLYIYPDNDIKDIDDYLRKSSLHNNIDEFLKNDFVRIKYIKEIEKNLYSYEVKIIKSILNK